MMTATGAVNTLDKRCSHDHSTPRKQVARAKWADGERFVCRKDPDRRCRPKIGFGVRADLTPNIVRRALS
jgi:hypothetical protein